MAYYSDSWDNWAARQKTVAVPGTAEQCPDVLAPTGAAIVFKAKDTNTMPVWLGPTQADAQDHTLAFQLAAGESLILLLDNANRTWVDAEVAGEGICIAVEQD